MRFVFFKVILFFFSLFVFFVEADPSKSKAEVNKSQAKEVQPQLKAEESKPKLQKEVQVQPQVKKEVQAQPQVKKEEQSPSQEKAVQPQPQVKKEKPQEPSGQLQILEIKKGKATVKVPANQKLSVDQILYVDPIIYPGDTPPQPPKKIESDVAERDGFVSLAFSPSFIFYDDFKYDDFYFGIGTSYGIVFGKSAVADAGIIEGALGLDGFFAPEGWKATVGFDVEINFIRNDGVNKIIPGLRLNVSLSYVEKLTDLILWSNPPIFTKWYKEDFGFSVNGGLYLKYFVLKQLALISSVDIGYGYFQRGLIGVGAELQIRMYF